MRRTSSSGSVNNLFSMGNPQLGQEATEVHSDWLNDVQEEICRAIESAGIVLDSSPERDRSQLFKAIVKTIQEGAGTISVDLTNNAGPLDIPGLLFDKTKVKSVDITFDIRRRTDTVQTKERGMITLNFDEDSGAWDQPYFESILGDTGVSFSITAVGQLQYTATNLAGANYVGKLRYSNIRIVKL